MNRPWTVEDGDKVIKKLMVDFGMPNSISLYTAFMQLQNEICQRLQPHWSSECDSEELVLDGSALPQSSVEAVGIKALDLSAIIRHAFLSGRGLKNGDKLSDEDLTAWTGYDPEPNPAYTRVFRRLYPTYPLLSPATDFHAGAEAMREAAVKVAEAEEEFNKSTGMTHPANSASQDRYIARAWTAMFIADGIRDLPTQPGELK